MERRNFMAKAAAGTAALVTLSSCKKPVAAPTAQDAAAASEDIIRWRMASAYPKGKGVVTFEDAEIFCERLRSITGGKFDISLYPAGELMGSGEVLDAAQQGTVECAHSSSSYHNDKDKTFNLGSTIPFGMNARQFTSWWYVGGGKDLFNAFYATYNVYAVQISNTGAQMGGFFKNEVNTVEDFKDLRMRNAGYGADILNQMGAKAEYIPAGDIAAVFERGELDSAEYSNPYEDEGLGLYKYAKYYYAPGWWETCAPSQVFVNLDAWNKLPKAYKEAFETVAAEILALELAKYDQLNPQALDRLVREHGVELRTFSDDIMEAAWQIARKIYADESAQNPAFAKIYSSQEQYMAQFISWQGISEWAMDAFIQKHLK